MKQLALTGAARLQLRLEAFNLFTRVNSTAPSGNRSTAAFGTITSAYDPRQMQLGVRCCGSPSVRLLGVRATQY